VENPDGRPDGRVDHGFRLPMPGENRNSIETKPNARLLVRSSIERRWVVLGAAAILFAAVFLLRQLGSTPSDGRALLYVLPVALIALELGLVAGLVAAGLATGLLTAWNISAEAGLGAAGILTRAVVFTAIGLIAGRFSDRMHSVNALQERLLDSGLALTREREAVGLDRRLEELATGLGKEGGGERLTAQDRAGLAMIGLHAAAARENLRLLERERQRVKLLELVFEGQENERSILAYELHEEAAQTLAAVLLGLDALARECTGDSAGRVRAVREQVEATLERCRRLAVGLRPPVLDGVGLVPALRRLAELPEVERVTVDPKLAAAGLPADEETSVYRAVEEAVRRVGRQCDATIALEPGGQELRVSVRPLPGGVAIGELGPLQARLDLLGGSLESGPQGLVARIPVRARAPVSLQHSQPSAVGVVKAG
jgi:signal transduction histidine kinase